MTVILGFKINDLPVLVGDIVISGPEELEEVTVIPTVGNSHAVFPEGSGWTITNLKQKVNIVSSNLMIAWAGDYSIAKYVISELKRRSESQQLTEELIHSFFTKEVPENLGSQPNVAFIGCIANDAGDFSFFDYAYGSEIKRIIHPTYGEVMICGCGAEDVQEILEAISRQSTREDLSDFHKVIIETLTLCGYLFARDEQSLLSLFGGGYEIATFSEKKFTKIGDYSYFYWFFHDNLNGKLDLVAKAYKVSYSDDVLLIYSIHVEQVEQADELDTATRSIVFPIEKVLIYPIPTLYLDRTENQLIEHLHEGIPVIESSLHCDFVFLVNLQLEEPLRMVIPIPRNYYNAQNNPIKFDMDGNPIKLIIDTSLLEDIKSAVFRKLGAMDRSLD
jgi:hypothetical protein